MLHKRKVTCLNGYQLLALTSMLMKNCDIVHINYLSMNLDHYYLPTATNRSTEDAIC